ncbi:hypothetical protein LFYK43_20320 [Ligilactobacillus salitolerans]|uniref:Uncharacterized protein n=1 Tax=Ligilactobacillus salitolerans TaxID=1808352 RepID=A0A401IVJ2_9LACO|nr:hypothetical protein [Ligilactobacillus salitolerans]GBG95573.1 hypothetical protein LFYK43_20320 [Ligilactobacillus salitolerans]
MAEALKRMQQKAEEALTEHNYVVAFDILSKLYLQKKTARNNYLLVQALAGQGKYGEAFTVGQEFLTSYLTENARFSDLIHVAVCARKGMWVEKILVQIKAYLKPEESRLFYGRLAGEMENFYRTKQQEISALKRRFDYLAAVSPIEQRAIVKEAEQLQKGDFVEGACLAVKDPNVHPLVRSSLLNDLRCLDWADEIMYQPFIGKQISLVPGDLQALEETRLFKEYTVQIEDNTRSPQESQQLLNELTLKLMLLYPQFEVIYQQPEVWYHILLNDQESKNLDQRFQTLAGQLEASVLEMRPDQKR